jgi:hypothetical protein
VKQHSHIGIEGRQSFQIIDDAADYHAQAVTMARQTSRDRTFQGSVLIMAAFHIQNSNRQEAWEGENHAFTSSPWFQTVHPCLQMKRDVNVRSLKGK